MAKGRRFGGSALVWRGHVRLVGQHTVELELHLAWFLTLCTIAWLLAQTLLPRVFPSWLPAAYWAVALSVAITDAVAGLVHELGHAIAALGKGRRVYRITLYGLAASICRSGGNLRPRDQAAIAMAGPISHLLIGAMLLTACQQLSGDNEPLRVAFGLPAVSNLIGGVLNLLPVLPLDGGRAVRAIVGALLGS